MDLSSLYASASPIVDTKLIFTARTWVAPKDCSVRITAFGASASGGVRRGGGGGATGGGAGARCTKTVKLKAGDTLTISPGAGGALNTLSTTGAQNGNDGGDTTVTGPGGLNMVAGGGKKGVASTDGTVALNGGVGGIATGGDVNVPGGRGGNAVSGSNVAAQRATGGGALPLFDVGYRGGDILIAIGNSQAATGGAGVGGPGGDISNYTLEVASGGGGSFGAGLEPVGNNQGGAGGASPLGTLTTLTPLTRWLLVGGPGAAGMRAVSNANGNDADVGGGSGGAVHNTSGSITSGKAGTMGGGGGASTISTGSATALGGNGTNILGATGGAIVSGNSPVTSAKAGDGFVVLEIF